MTIQPTPVRHPWIATARTILQYIASTILGVATLAMTLALVAPQILAALADVLPPEVYAWLVGVVAFLAALSGAIAKIMAIPQVNEWLTRLKLGYPVIDAGGTDGTSTPSITTLPHQ